jgi:hypothetical protein
VNAADTVDTLLETEEIPDAKYFSGRVPTVYDEAVQWAKNEFDRLWSEGFIKSPRAADEKMSELASDACAQYDLEDEDDYDTVVTELYKHSAELVKGTW